MNVPEETVNPQEEPVSTETEMTTSEFVEKFFNNIPRNPVAPKREVQAEADSNVETTEPVASQDKKPDTTSTPPAAEATPSPIDARIAELTDKLQKKDKSYNELQSTIDGRIHAATKDMRDALAQQTQVLTVLAAKMANPSSEPSYEQPVQQPQGLTQEAVAQLIKDAIQKDPNVTKSNALAELLEFRAANQDAERYDLFTQKVLEKFPELKQSRGLKGSLQSLYELGQELELTQLQMAKAMEEAAKTEAQKQQTQKTKTNGKLSEADMEKLREREASLTNEKSISSSPNPRPVIDKRMPYNKQIENVVDAWMRKLGA